LGTAPLMGINGSNQDITSAWKGHQATCGIRPMLRHACPECDIEATGVVWSTLPNHRGSIGCHISAMGVSRPSGASRIGGTKRDHRRLDLSGGFELLVC